MFFYTLVSSKVGGISSLQVQVQRGVLLPSHGTGPYRASSDGLTSCQWWDACRIIIPSWPYIYKYMMYISSGNLFLVD